ncbi:hypothetical protein WICPIJ_009344 [Wickerhamomyces pijperi]|uniref:Damage-regulated import facilitator 1 n=1 Tax=Wickerhamomyces pijperi TaxID=599730 RepID=A0A9P8TDI5_WICPI|nr:hypothetical protein WICPIJ_009344 [Wickerhamomyces pijperi]
MSQVKRQQLSSHKPEEIGTSPYQQELSTVGMRIRKSVAEGYQTSKATPSSNGQSTVEFGGFKRIPLPSNVVVPPLLSNMESSARASSFEEWDNNLELRLQRIDQGLQSQGFNKRSFSSLDEF